MNLKFILQNLTKQEYKSWLSDYIEIFQTIILREKDIFTRPT